MPATPTADLRRYHVLLDELRALRLRGASDDEDLDKQEQIEVLVDRMTPEERTVAKSTACRAWPTSDSTAAHDVLSRDMTSIEET